MTYGVPYKGSKNLIARKIISALPEGRVLVDLFAGGCAIAHAALEQMQSMAPKWDRVIVNDINPMPIELFTKAIDGAYSRENNPELCSRWISREDFCKLKDSDPYVRYCWSFGNDGRTYLYGRDKEPYKRALHFAMTRGDYSLLDAFLAPDAKVPDAVKKDNGLFKDWVRNNIEFILKKYAQWYASTHPDSPPVRTASTGNMKSLQSLEELERLETLERFNRLQVLGGVGLSTNLEGVSKAGNGQQGLHGV